MDKIQSIKRMIVAFAILGVVMGGIQVSAAVTHDRTVSCSLKKNKCVDSDFTDSTYGKYYILSLSCTPHSKYGAMAVLRGRPSYKQSAVWLMNPALSCAKGSVVTDKYDVYKYAKNHDGVSYSNQVGIRLYGNDCDDQKTGCYANALAKNTNQ